MPKQKLSTDEFLDKEKTSILDVLTKATISTEGLIEGQTPLRITNDSMRKWKTIQGVPINPNAKIPRERRNFFFVQPDRVEEVIFKQWRSYFKSPSKFGLSDDSTVEDVIKKFDQENPQNKVKLLQKQGFDIKQKLGELRKTLDLSFLNPFSVSEAHAGELINTDQFFQTQPQQNVLSTEDFGIDSQANLTTDDFFKEQPSKITEIAEKVVDTGKQLGLSFAGSVQGAAASLNATADFIGKNLTAIGRPAEQDVFLEQLRTQLEGVELMQIPEADKEIVRQSLKSDIESIEKVENRKANAIENIGLKLSDLAKDNRKFWLRAKQETLSKRDPELYNGTFMQNPSFLRGASIIAEAIPSLGAATTVAIMTKNPWAGAAALGFGVEAGEQFAESQEAGKDLKTSNLVFTASGIGTTLLEKIPITRFFKGGSGKIGKDIFAGATVEGTEEVLQTLWQNSIAKIGYDNTRDLAEGLVESFIGGAGSGGVIGGVTSGRSIRTDALIDKAIEKGISPEEIGAMAENIAEQIVDNAEEIDILLTESVSERIRSNPDELKGKDLENKIKETNIVKGEEYTVDQIIEYMTFHGRRGGGQVDNYFPNKEKFTVSLGTNESNSPIYLSTDGKASFGQDYSDENEMQKFLFDSKEQALKALRKTGLSATTDSGNLIDTIPDFNNTEEAVSFGNKVRGDDDVVELMKRLIDEREGLVGEIKSIKNPTDEDLQRGIDEATKNQFIREALEEATRPLHISDDREFLIKESKKYDSADDFVESFRIGSENLPLSTIREAKKIWEKSQGKKNLSTEEFSQGDALANFDEPQASKDPKVKADELEKREVAQKRPELEPPKTEAQIKKERKKQARKENQIRIETAEDAKNLIKEQIKQRRFRLNSLNFETNKFINSIDKITTRSEREAIPFIIEDVGVPEDLGRPDLVEIYNDSEKRKKLDPIAKEVKERFDRSWKYIVANTKNMSSEQIENYVTHIWETPSKKKAEATNWFITKNQFLKKRYVETLRQGIEELGLKPRILDIGEIIRIHDSVMNKTIENNKFVDWLKDLKTDDGTPLLAPSHEAPQTWKSMNHPALNRLIFIKGDPDVKERVSAEMQDLLSEMGVAVGRRIAPKAFGNPSALGLYMPSDPPEVRFQKFFTTSTLAHEIGHHIDSVLGLGEDFVQRHKSELYELNRDRIKRLSKSTGKYNKQYAESAEEQIAELFAFMFTDLKTAYKTAPNATDEVMQKLKKDKVLTKLVDFDFENRAKVLVEEISNKLINVQLKFHPDLEKPLRVIFGSRFHHPAIKAYENINGWLKKTKLSISLFHHFALAESSVATAGLGKTLGIQFNPVKIYKALKKNEFDVFEKNEIGAKWARRGLQFGATADIPVQKIQQSLNDLARKTKDVPLINKMTEATAAFNETWDKALWSYLHDTLKLYGAEALAMKIDHDGDVIKQEEEIAQIVNDTFGGQNWEVLMIDPQTIQIMTWSLLSADWTLSTLRQALAPTGIGAINKSEKKFRGKLGLTFWAKAALYFGVGINLLNALFRKRDEEENPEFYKDSKPKDLKDYTMFGNTIGHKTHLFVGRYSDGTERYIRWGKQFREFPEFIFDDFGFNPISASLKKFGGKLSPAIQHAFVSFSGVSPSGFVDREIFGKKGWDRTNAVLKGLVTSPIPFSMRNLLDRDRESNITDLAFPSSKGMSRYKAIEYFKIGIETYKKTGDDREIKEVYQNALRNKLPAFSLFSAALTSLKAEHTKEINSVIKSVDDIDQILKTNITDRERRTLNRKKKRLLKEQRDIDRGIIDFDRAIKKLENSDI